MPTTSLGSVWQRLGTPTAIRRSGSRGRACWYSLSLSVSSALPKSEFRSGPRWWCTSSEWSRSISLTAGTTLREPPPPPPLIPLALRRGVSAAIGGFVGLFLAAPVAGLALALTVAMAKGGLGGLQVLEATSGTDHLQTRFQRGLAAAVRGGAVMLVPIVFWPQTSTR